MHSVGDEDTRVKVISHSHASLPSLDTKWTPSMSHLNIRSSFGNWIISMFDLFLKPECFTFVQSSMFTKNAVTYQRGAAGAWRWRAAGGGRRSRRRRVFGTAEGYQRNQTCVRVKWPAHVQLWPRLHSATPSPSPFTIPRATVNSQPRTVFPVSPELLKRQLWINN